MNNYPASQGYGLELNGVRAGYGKQQDVLRDISLRVPENEILSILGASGAGKSTLLKAIAGIVPLRDGEIYLHEKQIDNLPINKRGIGFVFQDYALFPNLTVYENLAFPLRAQSTLSKRAVENAVKESAGFFGLTDLLGKYPHSLSGGQRQRTALSRAVISDPPLLLLDEALGAVDPILKSQIQDELLRIRHSKNVTIVYVTHDLDSAFAISDKIALLRDGVVEQFATPKDIYDQPNSVYTAQFTGLANVFEGEIQSLSDEGATLRIFGNEAKVRRLEGCRSGDKVDVVIRPEQLSLSCKAEDDLRLHGTIIRLQPIRGASFVEVQLECGIALTAHVVDEVMAREMEVGDIANLFIKLDELIVITKARGG